MGGSEGVLAGTPSVSRWRRSMLWQPATYKTGLKEDSLYGQALGLQGEHGDDLCGMVPSR